MSTFRGRLVAVHQGSTPAGWQVEPCRLRSGRPCDVASVPVPPGARTRGLRAVEVSASTSHRSAQLRQINNDLINYLGWATSQNCLSHITS